MDPRDKSPFVLAASPLMYDMADIIAERLKNKDVHMHCRHIEYTTFANGELLPRIPEPIRKQHVFFLHGLQHPDPNTAIMKMLLTHDAMSRATVAGITLVAPYLPYLRQDRKDKPRVPISARLLADLIESNPAVKQLITIDMHAEQEQGFFSIPVDNLTGARLFADDVRVRFGSDMKNTVMLAADFGAVVRTRRLAHALGDLPVSIFEKRRPGPNQAEIVSVIGAPVVGARILIYEDLIDTGHTLQGVIKKLVEMGAREVVVYATHAIFSKNAESLFATEKVLVHCTDSIPRPAEYYEREKWLTKIPIDAYLADAIYQATQMGGSISKL